MIMEAVVFAAGEGTRLRPLTADRPKAMVPVRGAPLLSYSLDAVRPLDPRRIVVVVGRDGDSIRDHFGQEFEGVPIVYARQPEPTGSAHALLAAAERLSAAVREIVVLNGDNVFRTDLRPLLSERRSSGRAATLLVERVPPSRAGQGVCVVDGHDRLRALIEVPEAADRRHGLISAGAYAFDRRVFEACRAVPRGVSGEHELSDAVNLLLRQGMPVGVVHLLGWRVNVNTPRDLARAEEALASAEGEP